MVLSKFIASGLLLVAGAASAVPALKFSISGDTFNSPFVIENTSTAGELVTRFVLDLTPLSTPGPGFCFDPVAEANTVCNQQQNTGKPFTAQGGTGATAGLLGPVSPADGAQVLDFSFNSDASIGAVFGDDANEVFSWVIDVDQEGNSDETERVFGNELIGAQARIYFSSGVMLTAILRADRNKPNGAQFEVTGRGGDPGTVPEPGTLALVGAAALALGLRRRRS